MPYSGLLDPPLVCDDLDAPAYAPEAILFDGSTDFMLRSSALAGLPDGKQGTLSAWIRADGPPLDTRTIFSGDDIGDLHLVAQRLITSNAFTVNARNAADAIVLNFTSAGSLSPEYRHVLASWDLATLTIQLYLDDASDLAAGSTAVDDDIAYSLPNRWNIGAIQSGALLFPGALSDFYFTDTFLDLTVESNRRKFIDEIGNPVFLGEKGENPTGSAATVYMRGNQTDQGINSGSGGDFVSQATQVPGETPGPVEKEDPPDPFPTPHSWNGL